MKEFVCYSVSGCRRSVHTKELCTYNAQGRKSKSSSQTENRHHLCHYVPLFFCDCPYHSYSLFSCLCISRAAVCLTCMHVLSAPDKPASRTSTTNLDTALCAKKLQEADRESTAPLWAPGKGVYPWMYTVLRDLRRLHPVYPTI